jgi:ATP-binding cassette, subfamily B, bacterial
MKGSMHRYGRLIRYALRQWPGLLVILSLTAASSAVTVLQPWPMKLLVDDALGHGSAPPLLRSLLHRFALPATPWVLVMASACGSLGLFVLNSCLSVGLSWAWTASGQRMVYDLAADLFHRFQRLSLLFHSRRSVGDSLSRLTGDAWCVYTVAEGLLISPARQLLTLGSIGAIAWHLDPGLSALSMAVAPVMAGSAVFFGRRLKQRARQGRELGSRLLSFVQQTLTAIRVVQAFGAEERNQRQFRRLSADAIALAQRGKLLSNAHELVTGFATTASAAVILYLGGQRVLGGTLSLGSLLVFLAYVRSAQGAVQGLFGTYVGMRTTEASIDRVMEIMEMEEGVRDAPGAQPLPAPRGHIRLEAVTFGYEPGRPVLHAVSLDAPPGQTLALVGPTGAGKSTLVSLLPRFFDPWEGRVTFDGRDLRELPLASLRAQIALVLQEPLLLPLTVAENIAYGRPGATREQIEAAAVAANADGFIRRLPQGYETVIGERGATLSGGERQRLSIARALLKDAPVLILDEPTSALDAQTEALLLEALERLMAGRTTFLIAHRLSTIRRADRILVLEGGKLVETGTQQELLAQCGLYHRLHSLQFPTLPREVSA